MVALARDARVLVVRLGGIRDVIMVGPAVRALRNRCPAAWIGLWVSAAGQAVARCLPGVDEILVGTESRIEGADGAAAAEDAQAALAAREFAAAFICTNAGETPYGSAFAAYAAGIPVRVGQSGEFGGALLTEWVRPFPDEGHPVDRNLHLFAQAGIPSGSREVRLTVAAAAHWRIRALLCNSGVQGPFVAVAPGGTCEARRYRVESYVRVLRLLRAQGLAAVVVGGAGDSALGTFLAAAVPGTVSLCGRLAFPEIVALLGRAGAFLGQNTGLMYVAYALSRPMVVLYAGTECPPQWLCRASQVTLLARAVPCVPCYGLTCARGQACLAIDAVEVAAAVMARTEGLRRPVRTHLRRVPASGGVFCASRHRLGE